MSPGRGFFCFYLLINMANTENEDVWRNDRC